jgi:hypothetical protein
MPAKRDPGKKKPGKKTDVLRLELGAPAAPRHVIATAQMFHDALHEIAPQLDDDDVTLVVLNRDLRSQLRGHTPEGRTAVGHVGDLLVNPLKKLQDNPGLHIVASTIARRLQPLAKFGPRVYRSEHGTEPDAVLGPTYTKSLQAAAVALRRVGIGPGIEGETVTYTPILRFGRQREDGPSFIRIRLGATFQEVEIEPQLANVCASLTLSQKLVPVRVRGRWVEGEDGLLDLKDPRAVSLDATFEAWSGADVLESVRENADAFGPDDLDEMVERINDLRGD